MIIVKLMGGLGNQMFQYAFGLYTALNNNTKLKLDVSFLGTNKKSGSIKNTEIRFFELEEIFNINNIGFTSKIENEFFQGDPAQNIVRRGIFKILRKIYGVKIYVQDKHTFNDEQLNIKNNTVIVGRWQSEKYFKPIEDIIRRQFIFRNPISKSYIHFINLIMQSPDATCLHIRRTDYVNHPIYSKILGALPDSYYLHSIQMINSLKSLPSLFIFSDDIEYTKRMLSEYTIRNDVTFIQSEEANPHDELHLMTLCKHFIISNSTYSWWGAWLSINKDKIVIAPEKWSLDPEYSSKYILPNNYIKILC